MKIHEHQASALMQSYGIPVIPGYICHDIDSCITAYTKTESNRAVVKAQVLSGGRGKAGGVKIINNIEELKKATTSILGSTINGLPVQKLMIVKAVDIAKEYYLSLVSDRKSGKVVILLSRHGGVDIEAVAVSNPEDITKIEINPLLGMEDNLARRAGFALFDDIDNVKKFVPLIKKLYRLFIEKDASLAEINPLVITPDNALIALDSKIIFDDNALFRHPDIQSLFEPTEEEIIEKEAKEKGFSYIHLDGSIGCMVNGAGLAMATLDTITLFGGTPANFLDIGGSSNPQKVIEAMKLLLSDKKVKTVLINIFGGITRCDDVANGLIQAMKQIECGVPIVIRLSGTNEKEGNEILKNTPFYSEQSMEKAIQKAVELSKL